MQRWQTALAVLGVLLALTACGGTGAAEGNVARGQELYTTGGATGLPCASCHTLDGSNLVGPSFQGIATRAAGRIADMPAEDYLRASIVSPSTYITPGYTNVMPAVYGETLSEEDIDALVAFLMTLN